MWRSPLNTNEMMIVKIDHLEKNPTIVFHRYTGDNKAQQVSFVSILNRLSY